MTAQRSISPSGGNGNPDLLTRKELRHTYASLAMAASSDGVAVQSALGHTDLATTQLYLSAEQSRTVALGARVEAALLTPWGHREGAKADGTDQNPSEIKGARSSYGQSTGLLSHKSPDIPAQYRANECMPEHAKSTTWRGWGSNSGGIDAALAAIRLDVTTLAVGHLSESLRSGIQVSP